MSIAELPWSGKVPDVEFDEVPFDGYVAHKHPHADGYVVYARDADIEYMRNDERFDFWWRMLAELGERLNGVSAD